MAPVTPPRREWNATAPAGDLPLVVGDVVGEKYRVEGLIGRGGMGVVFAATHMALGHRVALKVICAGGGPMQAEFVARFEQEARAVALLTSPHVARVFDVGHLDPSTPYMVMELLTGETLNKAIRRGRMPSGDVVRITREICDALGEAHSLGIVHRDLKGDNVFLAQRPNGQVSAKLLDFGISKVTNTAVIGDGEPLTNTRTFLGTPASMAPEQFTGDGQVTPKTDVWALGVLIFKMLTGTAAFHAPSMFETAEKVVRGRTPSLGDHRPDLHPAWSSLIEGALQKNPDERITLDEVLRRVLESERLQHAIDPGGIAAGGATVVRSNPLAGRVEAPGPVPDFVDTKTHTAVITGTAASASYARRMASLGVAPYPGPVPVAPPPAPPPLRWKAAVGFGLAAALIASAGVFAALHLDALHRSDGLRQEESRDVSSATAAPPAASEAAVVAEPPVLLTVPPVIMAAPAAPAAPAPSATAAHDAASAERGRPAAAASPRPRPPSATTVSPARSALPVERTSAAPASSGKPKPLTTER